MKIKALKRGVGQPRKYRKLKCPHCKSHWHTGNGKGREKCNDCGCTWAKREGEDELLETPPPIATPKKTKTASIPVEATNQDAAA